MLILREGQNCGMNAALIIGRNMQLHRHQEFIRVLNAIEPQPRAQRQIHVTVGDCATNKHPKARE
jgi:hypothetical protein